LLARCSRSNALDLFAALQGAADGVQPQQQRGFTQRIDLEIDHAAIRQANLLRLQINTDPRRFSLTDKRPIRCTCASSSVINNTPLRWQLS
jgi:hypothetical protein